MKSIGLLVFAILLAAASGFRSYSRASQQTGYQPKQDPSTAKGDTKPKKTGPTQETPSKTPADSSATAPASASAGATTAAKAAAAQPSRPANGGGMVWVNTESRVYHKPGSRYYGKTKQGKYMTEADAIKAGYHAAKKE